VKIFRITPPDAHVAFRLPSELLSKVDLVCENLDLSRSQVLRRAIVEYVKTLGVTGKSTES
jgi:predicted transcriptional regulator